MTEFLLYSQVSVLLYNIAGPLARLKKTDPGESYDPLYDFIIS